MSAEHKRPLYAFVLVTVLSMVLVGHALRSEALVDILRHAQIDHRILAVAPVEQPNQLPDRVHDEEARDKENDRNASGQDQPSAITVSTRSSPPQAGKRGSSADSDTRAEWKKSSSKRPGRPGRSARGPKRHHDESSPRGERHRGEDRHDKSRRGKNHHGKSQRDHGRSSGHGKHRQRSDSGHNPHATNHPRGRGHDAGQSPRGRGHSEHRGKSRHAHTKGRGKGHGHGHGHAKGHRGSGHGQGHGKGRGRR